MARPHFKSDGGTEIIGDGGSGCVEGTPWGVGGDNEVIGDGGSTGVEGVPCGLGDGGSNG